MTTHGDITPPGRCSLGLFHDDTRILSDYALRMGGGPPPLLSAEAPRTYAAQIDLAMKDLPFGGDPWDPKHAVHIRRELVLSDRLDERVTLTNYLAQPLEYWVELSLACDFADIFEVRGWQRDGRGQFLAPVPSTDRCSSATRARRTADRSVVRFPDPPDLLIAPTARVGFALRQPVRSRLEWEVSRRSRRRAHRRGRAGARRAARGGRAALSDLAPAGTRWNTDVPKFDVVLRRAMDDLRALYVEVDGDEVISAGIPWYSTVFGRDSIITSLETLPLNPRIARDTLRYLARRQGEREDPFTEEQPGKILHELRRGEMARAGEIPHVPYFGTVDATPLWLVLLHETWRWTGDKALVRELLPHAERALAWIDRTAIPTATASSNTPDEREGAGQPGLEGFRRRCPVPRRPPAGAADRAGRGAGLRLRCEGSHGRAVRPFGEPDAPRRWAPRRPAPARDHRAVLAGGPRHVRARARRPEASDPHHHLERGPPALEPDAHGGAGAAVTGRLLGPSCSPDGASAR